MSAAAITAERLRPEMDAVFDAAHRILPLVMRSGRDPHDAPREGVGAERVVRLARTG
ncbi:hypothetical protein [Rhodovulum sp. ES.010]|uniref:hypothetical protein n=1 Tax=Rhodovulum sp. ES.010 TaxID=1882821 RepID=UPI001587F8D4|nr:hypothetical protein [Rhodovulum sp. ES.010]